MLHGRSLSAAVAVTFMLAAGHARAADPLAYGKHLAGECTACHKADGQDRGIPSITGWDTIEFIETMKYYQSGARPNPAMQSVAQSLDEDQLKALATYFATLPKPAATKSSKN